ncbi:hypothetical protein NDU88_007036 [Pleurodeles waltl]|uniref:Uncharacterized protein n=1 Tax=Pleurodeles waltl TaxID=8319 RepID=A0AAV7TYQ3_PLEWA|nr:hypothetical protein NDU88_007036 [Pleurodeles waltl]
MVRSGVRINSADFVVNGLIDQVFVDGVVIDGVCVPTDGVIIVVFEVVIVDEVVFVGRVVVDNVIVVFLILIYICIENDFDSVAVVDEVFVVVINGGGVPADGVVIINKVVVIDRVVLEDMIVVVNVLIFIGVDNDFDGDAVVYKGFTVSLCLIEAGSEKDLEGFKAKAKDGGGFRFYLRGAAACLSLFEEPFEDT